MNAFQKLIYFYLKIKEKSLAKKLIRYSRKSASNSSSKTIISNGATINLSAETNKNKELVYLNVSDIVKSCNNNPNKLLSYIESKGTKVIKINNADKLLQVIKEEEGLITELEGLEALYINIITHSGFSLKSKPMFILREGEIDPYYMAHQFYKWYALQYKLPGFDYLSQKLFKIYLNSNSEIQTLNLEEIVGLKEAVERDSEATAFALKLANLKEGSKNVLDKIKNDGGANV